MKIFLLILLSISISNSFELSRVEQKGVGSFPPLDFIDVSQISWNSLTLPENDFDEENFLAEESILDEIDVEDLKIFSYIDDEFKDFETKPTVGIVGGNQAKIGQFPHQTLLLITKEIGVSGCGGSIISKSWVLTAAHCIIDAKTQKSIKVIAGIIDYQSRNGQSRVSKSHFSHPSYKSKEFYATPDIGLIRVDPFTFNKKVNKISIYPKNLQTQSIGTVAGWGYLDNEKTESDDLYFLNTNIITNSACKSRLSGDEKFITDNKVCTYSKKGKGFCQGDSGGGLQTTQKNKKYLVGVVSYNLDGCANGNPDVFERIYPHIAWIKKIISSNS